MPLPPRPPHLGPLPPIEPHPKPISPPLDSLPYHQPIKTRRHAKILVISILLGTIFTVVLGLILGYFKISINVILPVLAPIWVGSITLFQSIISKN
jgi:uncharacterized membrane protein